MPTWLCIPGCLVLGEWSHHCGYLGHEDIFCIVFLCIFVTSFFKFKLFIYFTLQHCIGFAIHWLESAMGVHVFPILNPYSQLPPHPIPLGHPSAPAPSILYHASNLDWRFISHMVVYMFQCHSPISSHRVQKTVQYICVSLAVSNTGLSLPSF